jgi:hypothetical protein
MGMLWVRIFLHLLGRVCDKVTVFRLLMLTIRYGGEMRSWVDIGYSMAESS